MNILIADDVEGWLIFHRKYLKEFLKDKKPFLIPVMSAKEGYDFTFCYDGKIDLVITDMQMENAYEKFAGEWLIENLKTLAATQDAKYIIISSAPDIHAIAQRTNADGYLRKSDYIDNPALLKDLLEEIFTE